MKLAQGILQELQCRIDSLLTVQDRIIVGIDGPCASGKTTLAQALSDLYACPVIHIDDFFLPEVKKTSARLAQPGGNVDFERFLTEVLSPLSQEQPVYYRPYSCKTGTLQAPIAVPPCRLVVIEGVYCMRPELAPFYTLTVFLSASLPVRYQRLCQRGGEELLKRFIQEWIPLEDSYFSAFEIERQAELSFET